jgi:hypothetical protein
MGTRAGGKSMQEILLWFAVVGLGVIVRFGLGQIEACRVIGLEIAEIKHGTGCQDAITPPASTNRALLSWAASAGLIGWMFWSMGIGQGVLASGLFLTSGTIAGLTIVPKPDSPFWVRIIYRSLVTRIADYRKANDHMRADAAEDLAQRIEQRFLAACRTGIFERALGGFNGLMPDFI